VRLHNHPPQHLRWHRRYCQRTCQKDSRRRIAGVPEDLRSEPPPGIDPEVAEMFIALRDHRLEQFADFLETAMQFFRDYPELVKAGALPQPLMQAFTAGHKHEPAYTSTDDSCMHPDFAAQLLREATEWVEEKRQEKAEREAAVQARAEEEAAEKRQDKERRVRYAQMQRDHVIAQDDLYYVNSLVFAMHTMRTSSPRLLRRRLAAGWTVEPGRYRIGDLASQRPVIDTEA
jgi:hypothetical protein